MCILSQQYDEAWLIRLSDDCIDHECLHGMCYECEGCAVQWHVQCTQGRGRQLRLLAPVAPRPRTWHQCSLTSEAGQWWPWSVSAPGRRMSTLAPGHWASSCVIIEGTGGVNWHWHHSSRPLLRCLSSDKMCVKSSVVNFEPVSDLS